MNPSPKLISLARWTLLLLASALTLVALVVVVENWRGDRAWRACEAELRARGEPLEFASFNTPPVPEARNFLQASVLAAISHSPANQPPARAVLAGSELKIFTASLLDNFTDLLATRARFARVKRLPPEPTGDPAAELLSALRPAAPLLDSIVEAARERPEAWVPFRDPVQTARLEVSTFHHIGRLLAFRAYLATRLGRGADAFGDLRGILRLDASMQTGARTLLQTLVGEAILAAVGPALEEGCRRHLWSDAQLAELQQQFSRHRSIAALRTSLQVERTWAIIYLDRLDDPALKELNPPWWFFHGWAQQNKVRVASDIELALTVLDAPGERIHLDRLAEVQTRNAERKASRAPYIRFARLMSMKLDGFLLRQGESANLLAQLAATIALERHWLDHEAYPTTLAELAHGPAPHDALDGQPLGYTRLSADNYTLTHLNADGRTRTTWTLRSDVKR